MDKKLRGIEILDKKTKIIYERFDHSSIPFRLYHAHIDKKNLNHTIPAHYHSMLEVIMPSTGEIHIKINDQVYPIYPGHIGIISPDIIHSIVYMDCDMVLKNTVFQLSKEFIEELIPDIDHIYFDIHIDEEIEKKMILILNQLDEEYLNHVDEFTLSMKGYLYILIDLLGRYQARTSNNHTSEKSKENIIEILQYIEENYMHDLTVEHLADTFHFSYGYFERMFKNNMNCTIKKYIDDIRLKRSEYDLIYTDLNISEIALKHGFTNLNSFNRIFKKTYQCTPIQYRKEVRK